jgi:hypothetical protein
MTLLTTVGGSFHAHVLAARLASEGIEAQLRGAVASPYGLTMGDIARIDVYVPAEQLDDARYVLLNDEVDASMAAPTEWWNAGVDQPVRARWPWFVALVLICATVLGVFLGVVRHW